MKNDDLLEKAKEAINDLFCDMSVSKSQTRDNLDELVGDIKIMIDTLEEDE